MISTISHIRFDPASPSRDDLNIEDIAHALSLITRANGHFDCFYSVARHCINCAKEAKSRGYTARVQLLCLLHDAAEAYIGDMTRPLKKKMPVFSEIEKKYQDIIFPAFVSEALTEADFEKAKSVDDCLLYHEFLTFNGEALFENAPKINISVRDGITDFKQTKEEFLNLYNELRDEL